VGRPIVLFLITESELNNSCFILELSGEDGVWF